MYFIKKAARTPSSVCCNKSGFTLRGGSHLVMFGCTLNLDCNYKNSVLVNPVSTTVLFKTREFRECFSKGGLKSLLR